jgi:integrase
VARQSKINPPGCVVQRRNGFYWKIPKSLAEKFDGKIWVPLLEPGKSRGATKNRRTAEAVRRRMWTVVQAAGDRPTALSGDPVAAFEEAVALGSSEANAKHQAGKIRALAEFAADRGVAIGALTPDVVEAFFAELRAAGRAANTLYNYYGAIGNFSKWACHDRRDILAGDLLDGIPRPRQDKPQLRYLSKWQAAVAWDTVRRFAPKIERHFLLAMWTGARRAEIPTIMFDDFFNGDDGRAWLRIRNLKTQSERSVPVAPRLMRHLVRWGYPWRKTGPVATPVRAVNTLGHDLVDLIADHPAGMPVFGELDQKATGNGWHLLRHTFASWAVFAGVDIRVLKEWLGHKSIQTTMIYAAIRPTTSGDLIDRL